MITEDRGKRDVRPSRNRSDSNQEAAGEEGGIPIKGSSIHGPMLAPHRSDGNPEGRRSPQRMLAGSRSGNQYEAPRIGSEAMIPTDPKLPLKSSAPCFDEPGGRIRPIEPRIKRTVSLTMVPGPSSETQDHSCTASDRSSSSV